MGAERFEPDFFVSKPKAKPQPEGVIDLFGESERPKPAKLPAHQSHSETSKAAALRIVPKAEGMRYEVLSVIADAGDAGATRKEVEQATGMLTQSVTPRICELKEAGLIRPLTYFS